MEDFYAHGQVFRLVADGTPVGYAAVAYGFSLEFGGRNAITLRLLQDACRRLGARSLALEVNFDNAKAGKPALRKRRAQRAARVPETPTWRQGDFRFGGHDSSFTNRPFLKTSTYGRSPVGSTRIRTPPPG